MDNAGPPPAPAPSKPSQNGKLAILFLAADPTDLSRLQPSEGLREIQADAIAQDIGSVIGLNQEIGDRAAIVFAIGFYQALGAGRALEDADKPGCTQIRLEGIPEHLTPVLVKRS